MLWLVRMFSTQGLTTAPSLLRVAVKGTASAPGLTAFSQPTEVRTPNRWGVE